MSNRIFLFVCFATLGLTACTDQPADPEATATVTEQQTDEVSDEASKPLPSGDRITDSIAAVLERPNGAALPQGSAALEELSGVLESSVPVDDAEKPDTTQCLQVVQTRPEVAGYGTAEPDDAAEDSEEITGLAALGFDSAEDATAATDELQEFTEACAEEDYELELLTHHTDEAFEIRLPLDEEDVTSVVIVRNANWVYLAASSPSSDVGLGLTLIDQLDEMLR